MLIFLTYDAPHYKSERLLTELVAQGLKPDLVVGAPWRKLKLPPAMRITTRHHARHPRSLCTALGLRYQVQPYEELEGGGLGVIGGARILPGKVVERFEPGIINLHPGIIPKNRGLSNLSRAVDNGWPQVVTAHLIDRRIDAGRVLFERRVPVKLGDTVFDVGERMLDMQVSMVTAAVLLADGWAGEPIPDDCGGYLKPLSLEDEKTIIGCKWESYVLEQSGSLGENA